MVVLRNTERNKKALIIDDNDRDRKVIAQILEKQGYKDVVLAQAGKEGILKAQFDDPDLVILCEQLPDMNGFEVCRKIKASEGIVAKIIMITGDDFDLNTSQARKAGADDYVVKTFDFGYLIQAISFIVSGLKSIKDDR